jgi:hypothetical protein
MDFQQITHQGYRLSILVAMVLSAVAVTLAALIGRGTLNLRGSLILEEPTDITVIALMETTLPENIKVAQIDFLREEAEVGGKPTYAYHVGTSDLGNYFVRLYFDREIGRWAVAHAERLRETPAEETL